MASMARKITLGFLGILVLAIAGFAIALSHEAPCSPAPALAGEGPRMKAVTRRCYGPPEVIAVEELERPVPADDQMLVRVHAAALNALDWHTLRGTPYMMRIGAGFGAPANPRLGIDFSGTVVAVGKDVRKYKPGDEIFGGRFGAIGEYLTVRETSAFARKPANVSFEQAAGVYVAGLTALQTLRDHAGVQPGQKVLINGASGGVGTFAVQVAKWLGAEVTAVCSTRNVELVRSLGADHVIDYTQADFTLTGERFDVVMDNVANRNIRDIRRILKPRGQLVVIGGGGVDANPWIGAFIVPAKAMVTSWFVDQEMGLFISSSSREDIETLAQLMEQGHIRTMIDRRYPLAEAAEAMRYLETGRARAKVIITMDPAPTSAGTGAGSSG